MRYVLKADEMKRCDEDTINRIGVPSMVLMERAALSVAFHLLKKTGGKPGKVLVAAGTGNNGGDGLAIGRLLALKGYKVTFFLAGNPDKMTQETADQLKILENLGFSTQSKLEDAEYDMVIDALFGIGLSREIEGAYADLIAKINRFGRQGAYICAVDIPSGICADTGKVLGCAVKADLTVTFAFAKRGHLLYPGKEYSGKLVVEDIGITAHSFIRWKPAAFYYEKGDILDLLPLRAPDGNKGTFGKVLLLAGSKDMSGACILCGNSIMRSGAGMVKIVTPDCNRQIIQQSFPEAMLQTYEEVPDMVQTEQSMKWCDVIVAGPGMGTGKSGYLLMKQILKETDIPMVIDADGLNLMAAHKELMELAAARVPGKTILTPHPGELNRLLGTDMTEYKKEREHLTVTLARKLNCIVAAKDAVTMVVNQTGEEIYINTSGNDGMATAGSGDVLAGVAGAFLAQGMNGFEAACLSVYLHGTAGEQAGLKYGRRSVIAGDLIKELASVMNCQ